MKAGDGADSEDFFFLGDGRVFFGAVALVFFPLVRDLAFLAFLGGGSGGTALLDFGRNAFLCSLRERLGVDRLLVTGAIVEVG